MAAVALTVSKDFLHSPETSSMLEMPLSHISTSERFFSRVSSTIFFKDLDIFLWKHRTTEKTQHTVTKVVILTQSR